jgi:dipeptidyl aminopeptidase/acylaminoacyl peptidase/pterin-4a-carbinolamine dehydratase
LYDLVTVEDPRLSPDGRTVAFVRMQADRDSDGYRRTIWTVPADGSAEPRAFTGGTSDTAPRWSPDGQQLLFVSARDGSPQLYLMPVDGGEARRLTDVLGGVSNPVWSPDGQHVAFNAQVTAAERRLEDRGVVQDPACRGAVDAWRETHREALRDPRVIEKLPYRTGTSFFDGQYRHVYVVPVAGGAPRRLTDGDFHHSEPDWTPDSRYVLTNSNREQSSGDEFFELWSTILKYDVESGEESVVIFEVSEEGRPVRVSPDGRWVAYVYLPKVESPYQEQYHVAVSSLEGGEPRVVSADEELTVDRFVWDADSEHLMVTIHDRGDAKLARLSRQGGEPEVLVEGTRWVREFSLSADGRRVAYAVTAPLLPSELFVTDLESGEERQLTDFNGAWVDAHALSEPVEIWYQGEGDVDVQGWFMRPIDFDPERSYPLAVEIHGGPQVMWGNTFWHEFQVLASRGYYVFFCNPRGSAGYGEDFQKMRGKGGYTDAPDIIAGAEWVLEHEPAADAERQVVTGGSYGGFLTAWIVGHYHRFQAAVAQRGVYDQLNMFGSGDIPESIEWYHSGIPRPENLSELWEYSPASYAEEVTTPLMLLHSDLDYRVPVSQAETFFAALRRRGNRDAVMVRYPREGHGLSRIGHPVHRVDRLYKILRWFDRHVQPEKLRPEPLPAAELEAAMGTLPGWERDGDALTRTVDCGRFGAGLALVQRIAVVAEDVNHHPEITLKGGQVLLRLTTHAAGGITGRDVHLARLLNRRIFS